MGKKYEKCVTAVKKANIQRYGRQKYNAWAVCNKSVGRLNAKKKKYFVLKVNKEGLFDKIAEGLTFGLLKKKYPKAKKLFPF